MTQLHVQDPNPSGNPAVLCLHGLGATGSSWQLQFPALSKAGFRPLAPDAPGFGESSYDGKGWNIARIVEQLAQNLVENNAGSVHVVGLSMGGVIAQRFARDFPHLTRKLILVSTFAVLRPRNLSGWFYFLQRLLAVTFLGLPAQAKIVARRVFPDPNQEVLREYLVATIAEADVRAYRAAMRSLSRFDSRKWLPQINVPTLIISGTEDTTVSPQQQKTLAELIPGARQICIPNAGHAVNIDQADEFNRILLEFIA